MTGNNIYGFPQPLTQVFPSPVIAQRSPLTTDFKYPIGQEWVDAVGKDVYILVDITSNSATWDVMAQDPGTLQTLTADSGGTIVPVSNNIDLLGTATEITTTGSGSTITFSVPATFVAPGSIESTTTFSVGTDLDVTGNSSLTGTLGVTGLTTLAALTQVGTASINGSGAGTTAIGSSAGGNITITGSPTSTTAIVGNGGTINIGIDAASNDVVVGSSLASVAIQAGTNSLSVLSGQIWKEVIISSADSPYTVLGDDCLITVDASVAIVTVNLPASPVTGRYILVIDETGDSAAHNITISGNGKQISDASSLNASIAINTAYDSKKLYFTGTIWQTV